VVWIVTHISLWGQDDSDMRNSNGWPLRCNEHDHSDAYSTMMTTWSAMMSPNGNASLAENKAVIASTVRQWSSEPCRHMGLASFYLKHSYGDCLESASSHELVYRELEVSWHPAVGSNPPFATTGPVTGPAAQGPACIHWDHKDFCCMACNNVGWFPHELAVSHEAAFSHVYKPHSTQLCTRPSVGLAAGRTWLKRA